MVHWYSRLGEKMLRLTYDPLGVNLTRTLEVCDGFKRLKENECAVRKKTYK